jgi:3-oxoacyl-[acyl-carrier-protein] synthase-3
VSKEVYITRVAKFLPNEPVSNDDIEKHLGMVNGKPSRAKSIVLRNNGIKSRYYAMDTNGVSTHTNAQLAKNAVENLLDTNFTKEEIELLACGTTSPDQLLPSHATMVLGELKTKSIETLSVTGSCCTGIQAMNHCYLSILAGNVTNGVCTGSEKLSTWMQAAKFEEEDTLLSQLESNPMLSFDKEFLRWMLSDGAAALLLSDKPNSDTISLKIDWIEQKSFANEQPVCMYAGAVMDKTKGFTSWNDMPPAEWATKSVFSLKQDTKMLAQNIVPLGGKFLLEICKKRNYDVANVNYFLPHLSSMFFAKKIEEELDKIGIGIPAEKWFTNLTKVGNIGSASAFLMIEELFNSDKLKKGDKLLLMIPESARFSYAYVALTVV